MMQGAGCIDVGPRSKAEGAFSKSNAFVERDVANADTEASGSSNDPSDDEHAADGKGDCQSSSDTDLCAANDAASQLAPTKAVTSAAEPANDAGTREPQRPPPFLGKAVAAAVPVACVAYLYSVSSALAVARLALVCSLGSGGWIIASAAGAYVVAEVTQRARQAFALDPVLTDDKGTPPTHGPVANKFCRFRYALLFFVMTGLAVALCRSFDWLLAAVAVLPYDSPPELQPVWEYVTETAFPRSSRNISFGGWVGFASFMCFCIGFTVLDIRRCVETKVQKDWWPTTYDMLRAGVPQVIIYFIGNYVGQEFFYQETALPAEAPRLCKLAEEVILAFVVGDLGIYWEHRIMHMVPFLRNNIHSWHHHYHAPFSWAGGVVHPFEDAIVVVTQTWFPLVMGHHPLSFWLFTWIWVGFLIEEHSGHDVWWAPYNWLPFARCPLGGGAAPHDIHHYKVTKNFGFVLCVWDHLFETFEAVVEPPALPANRAETWWEFSRFSAHKE